MRTKETMKSLTALVNENLVTSEIPMEDQILINGGDGGRAPEHQSLWEKWLKLLTL